MSDNNNNDVLSKIVKDYLDRNDWRVNENSNVNYSLSGLNNYISGEVIKNYWLREIYADEIGKAHADGDFHIHDLSGLCVYCCGHDLSQLLLDGFGGVPGKSSSAPAKHFRTALLQIVNFLFTLQNEASGAQAFSSFDTYLAPFIREDGLTYKEVKQCLQEFCYNMNISTRQGGQCPFTNVTLDFQCPERMKNEPVILGGVYSSEHTYGEYQEEMNLFNKAFLNVMTEGDSNGRVFPFPVITVNVDKDFDWENKRYMPLWENTAKYGLTYFCNYINSDMSPDDSRSMCPLDKDTEILVKDENSIHNIKIEDFYANQLSGLVSKYQVWTGKEWKKAVANIQGMQDSVCISFSNGDSVVMGLNHLNYVPSLKKTIPAKELKEGMMLPFNKRYEGFMDDKHHENYDGTDENWNYYRIEKITPCGKHSLFCLEVDSDDHLFMLANGLITHNCRLRLSLTEIRKRGGGLFGANPKTGSIGVVTINLPRLGYMAKTEEDFFARLSALMDMASESLEVKRKTIEKHCDENLYPFTKHYMQDVKSRFGSYFANHFSTIGFVGLNECCQNFFGKEFGLASEKGHDFGVRVLDYMNQKILELQEKTGALYNLEATPAEGTSYRLALKDKKKFGKDIIVANQDSVNKDENVAPYYTNSCQLPVDSGLDIFSMLNNQNDLQTKMSGGTVVHIFIGEKIKNPIVARDFVKRVLENYNVPYISLTPTFSVCQKHGYMAGECPKCPECGEETEVYSRVVGYLRPVKNWNKGKKEEFKDRKTFKINAYSLKTDAALAENAGGNGTAEKSVQATEFSDASICGVMESVPSEIQSSGAAA